MKDWLLTKKNDKPDLEQQGKSFSKEEDLIFHCFEFKFLFIHLEILITLNVLYVSKNTYLEANFYSFQL